jgi:hypothetical protein
MWLDKGRLMEIGAPYDTVKHYLEAQGLQMIDVQPGMAQTMVNVPDVAT